MNRSNLTILVLLSAVLSTWTANLRAENHPDVLTIAPDLENPAVTAGDPAPGKMVLQFLPAYAGTEVAHALYLPTDWAPGKRFPVLIEYCGNGSRVRDGNWIGYGITGGKGFIWAVLPFVSADRKKDMDLWWGDVAATVAYAKEVVPALCRQWGGDPKQVILVGHSRGAIACNYIGLHDDAMAKLWRTMIPFSHYDDGHEEAWEAWGMTPEEQRRAPERLRRLGSIPQFICGEHTSKSRQYGEARLLAAIKQKNLATFTAAKQELGLVPLTETEGTRQFIAKHHPGGNYTIVDLPCVNHTAKFMLRDTPARQQLREWLQNVLLPTNTLAAAVPPGLDASYPGGNARIVGYEGGTFTLAPDLRDTKGWWFNFNFRLRGPTDQPLTIRFADADPIGVRGPATSTDGGRTWQWLGREAVRHSAAGGSNSWSFQAVVPAGAQEARYAFAPTYLESHLREWLAAQQANPALQVSELCRSRKGRGVELLRAGCLDPAKARGVVLLTARHHACESMASYVLEGFLTAVLADDETGRRWRERWQVIALPFADKDGVEEGDQGKNRVPHDHCRDYNDKPIYPEVAAWMKLGDSLKQRVVFSLDMHCPYLRGDWSDRVHFVGSPTTAAAEKEKAFVQVLERVQRGPLPFRAADGYLPHGVAWNTPAGFAAGRSNFYWAGETFPEARFTGAIEVPYAEAQGVEVNADSARALGRDLARAALEHLEP